jgi:hypothetical protein
MEIIDLQRNEIFLAIIHGMMGSEVHLTKAIANEIGIDETLRILSIETKRRGVELSEILKTKIAHNLSGAIQDLVFAYKQLFQPLNFTPKVAESCMNNVKFTQAGNCPVYKACKETGIDAGAYCSKNMDVMYKSMFKEISPEIEYDSEKIRTKSGESCIKIIRNTGISDTSALDIKENGLKDLKSKEIMLSIIHTLLNNEIHYLCTLGKEKSVDLALKILHSESIRKGREKSGIFKTNLRHDDTSIKGATHSFLQFMQPMGFKPVVVEEHEDKVILSMGGECNTYRICDFHGFPMQRFCENGIQKTFGTFTNELNPDYDLVIEKFRSHNNEPCYLAIKKIT